MPQLPRRIKCVPLFRTSCETALKENNIVLQRQRSWCVSKDSQFAEKVADIVGLYLPPPRGCHRHQRRREAWVQAKTQKKGYVRNSGGTVVMAVNSTYRRDGTTNLFATLDVASGSVKGKTTKSKKREDFLSFMDEVVEDEGTALSEGRELYVILDNYCTHKRCTEWLARNPRAFPLPPHLRKPA